MIFFTQFFAMFNKKRGEFLSATADRPVRWQRWHQDRATAQIEGITDLNRDIHFFLAVI
jgi:hypothetical protein